MQSLAGAAPNSSWPLHSLQAAHPTGLHPLHEVWIFLPFILEAISSFQRYRSPLRLSLIPAAETLITLPGPAAPGLLGLLVLLLEAWVIHNLATGFFPYTLITQTGTFQPSSVHRSCLQRCSWVLL